MSMIDMRAILFLNQIIQSFKPSKQMRGQSQQ